MKIDESSQLFLLLAWVITVAALIAAIWLFRDIRSQAAKINTDKVAPYVIPPSSAAKPAQKFEVPPPPF